LSAKERKITNRYFEVYELLSRAQHAMYNSRERQLRQYGITPDQSYILLRIHQLKNKATQAQIAYFVFRKQNTVSVNVKRMEKQGLLKRNVDRKRKNGITLSLTKKGEEIYRKTLNREPIDNIMSSLSSKQIEQLSSYLDTIFTAAANELAKFHSDSFLKTVLNNLRRI
jgi:MarR family 2-MHQ and catechol resistance regulon transcriptional repressor